MLDQAFQAISIAAHDPLAPEHNAFAAEDFVVQVANILRMEQQMAENDKIFVTVGIPLAGPRPKEIPAHFHARLLRWQGLVDDFPWSEQELAQRLVTLASRWQGLESFSSVPQDELEEVLEQIGRVNSKWLFRQELKHTKPPQDAHEDPNGCTIV